MPCGSQLTIPAAGTGPNPGRSPSSSAASSRAWLPREAVLLRVGSTFCSLHAPGGVGAGSHAVLRGGDPGLLSPGWWGGPLRNKQDVVPQVHGPELGAFKLGQGIPGQNKAQLVATRSPPFVYCWRVFGVTMSLGCEEGLGNPIRPAEPRPNCSEVGGSSLRGTQGG